MSNRKKQNENRSILLQWGVPVVLLVVVVIFLISSFVITSKEGARNNTNKQLITEVEMSGINVKSELMSIAGAARGVAATIGAELDAGHDVDIVSYLSGVVDEFNQIDLVVYTDDKGKGKASDGSDVDLSNEEYRLSDGSDGFSFVNDESNDGKGSFVYGTPVRTGEDIAGYLYVYANPANITAVLPMNNYGGNLSYGIVDSTGRLIYILGSRSEFFAEGNLFSNLADAKMEVLTYAQVKLRVEKKTKMIFDAFKGDESKIFVVTPLGIGDWMLVAGINHGYVDAVIFSEMENPRKLIIKLAIAIIVFIIFLVVNAVVNRIKYGEQSKNLEDKADTDLLTGLNNKIATERKIQEYMTENPDSQCLMFLFDIDNFKKINDTMGHAFGDEVLQTLGHQLTNEFRVTDIIGRLGGDEFVLFLKNIKSDEQLEREGIRIANFFHQFKAGNYVKYSATASIGGVVFPRDAKDFQSAYKAADVALYEAKRRGKNQLVFYSRDIADVKSVRVSDDVEPIGDYRAELEKKAAEKQQ